MPKGTYAALIRREKEQLAAIEENVRKAREPKPVKWNKGEIRNFILWTVFCIIFVPVAPVHGSFFAIVALFLLMSSK